MSSYYPILFSTPMVRAILDGRKTVTRRVFPTRADVGDTLWVRETWAANVPGCSAQGGYIYRADHIHPEGDGPERVRWHPSIHMPRDAARIYLLIVEKRLELLAAITNAQAREEGFENVAAFSCAWHEMYGNHPQFSWRYNPEVTVLRFKRVEG